jgi:hypothetical protein
MVELEAKTGSELGAGQVRTRLGARARPGRAEMGGQAGIEGRVGVGTGRVSRRSSREDEGKGPAQEILRKSTVTTTNNQRV